MFSSPRRLAVQDRVSTRSFRVWIALEPSYRAFGCRTPEACAIKTDQDSQRPEARSSRSQLARCSFSDAARRHREIVVLVLALTVVMAGRFGGRAGGIAAALMAAATFDFFHTEPYLSLRIDKADDIGATFVLLAVGLVAGGLSARASRDRHIATDREVDADAVSRVLGVAGERPAADVEYAVRAELLTLLNLSDCWFTREPVALPALGPNGSLSTSHMVHRGDGFELPPDGVLMPVTARGERFGSLVCMPVPDSRHQPRSAADGGCGRAHSRARARGRGIELRQETTKWLMWLSSPGRSRSSACASHSSADSIAWCAPMRRRTRPTRR